MTAVINRTPTGRLISLHAEIKYLYARFRDNLFDLKGMKYDSESKLNPLMFFPLAKEHPSIGLYDPYLENPLSLAKFHLTQSIQYDAQKSKSVSECLNALEALGWAERINNKAKLTKTGIDIANVDYKSEKFFNISKESVLGYGVFIGFLFNLLKKMDKNKIVKKSDIVIGYPDTREFLEVDGIKIPLSIGSQKDTIVRTRSTLFAWAFTTGFIVPEGVKISDKKRWHVISLDQIKEKHWSWNKFKIVFNKDLFSKKIYVQRPLNYTWMTKSIKALRERGQQQIRNISLKAESVVKNRRFAIVYCLGVASKHKRNLNFQKLIKLLNNYPDIFVTNKEDFFKIMESEKQICNLAGLPFIEKNGNMKPLTELNLEELSKGAPKNLVKLLNKIARKAI